MKKENSILDWFEGNKYLVYQTGACEMGSEGSASYYGYAICEGSTEEEIMECYKKQRNLLYGIDINPEKYDGKWYDYYEIVYNILPMTSVGDAKKLIILKEVYPS